MTLFTLPVAYPSGDAFLKMCLDIAEATGPAIFDNEVVIIALQHGENAVLNTLKTAII